MLKIVRQITGCVLLLLVLSTTSCVQQWRKFWGDNDLGNNLSLLEGDKTEERVVVYCSGRSGAVCSGGIYVVPAYEQHYDAKGNYAEYADSASSNEKWIIVKTIRVSNKQHNYWIINKGFDLSKLDCMKVNCDSVIQAHVTGPLTLNDFEKKIKQLNLNLKFK